MRLPYGIATKAWQYHWRGRPCISAPEQPVEPGESLAAGVAVCGDGGRPVTHGTAYVHREQPERKLSRGLPNRVGKAQAHATADNQASSRVEPVEPGREVVDRMEPRP